MFAGYTMGELGSIMAMQGFAGLILFSVFVLMALGLAIIFGQMGVINMAHGEFMILGAYVTYLTSQAIHEVHAGPVLRLFLRRRRAGVHRVRRARHVGRVGADPPPLQAAARYAAGDVGPEPRAAAGLSLGVRRARGRRRSARTG